MDIKLNIDYLDGFVRDRDFQNIIPRVEQAHQQLVDKTGKGNLYTGWIDLPEKTEDSFLDELIALGKEVRGHSDALISIGIGGSYTGIRASLEFLIGEQKLPVYFLGNNLSSGYVFHCLKQLKDQDVSVVVISKSGTTTEPALAFRIVHKFMEEKYSDEELKKRILCVTDKEKGSLLKIAKSKGYRSFVIPDDVGGRFSIFTPVGLVPLAIAGLDIKGMIEGARKAQKHCSVMNIEKNISYKYAAARFLLFQRGKVIEVLSTFYQRLSFLEEWWKQLFGESEGKDGKGIFPTSLSFTADLHSMGQFLQEGLRNMFETFITAERSGFEMIIPKAQEDIDNFNCVAGKDLDYVNKAAYEATAKAHYEGGVPNMTISIPEFSPQTLGELYYFFEKATAITGYLLDVNPFNQPGVEAYKKMMFDIIGRK